MSIGSSARVVKNTDLASHQTSHARRIKPYPVIPVTLTLV